MQGEILQKPVPESHTADKLETKSKRTHTMCSPGPPPKVNNLLKVYNQSYASSHNSYTHTHTTAQTPYTAHLILIITFSRVHLLIHVI